MNFALAPDEELRPSGTRSDSRRTTTNRVRKYAVKPVGQAIFAERGVAQWSSDSNNDIVIKVQSISRSGSEAMKLLVRSFQSILDEPAPTAVRGFLDAQGRLRRSEGLPEVVGEVSVQCLRCLEAERITMLTAGRGADASF